MRPFKSAFLQNTPNRVAILVYQAAEKILATDSHECTRIGHVFSIRVYPCWDWCGRWVRRSLHPRHSVRERRLYGGGGFRTKIGMKMDTSLGDSQGRMDTGYGETVSVFDLGLRT
jgi:hypothetical protein